MRATDLISVLSQRGITLKVVSGGLRISGAEKLTNKEKATLKRHKPAILKALVASLSNPTITSSPTAVASSTAVAELLARECGNCANFEKYPYEPLGSCHARRKMQHAASQPRQFGCGHFQPAAGKEGRP